ncbi:multicopper oxidase family protein [Rothia sp. ZJ932]|uniref:multicopper oxidase family protein n=1 Tax=Rothia sp. ZJ932 TaxID=2810516 RepID=UPI00196859E5|nr:multicopper oxidase domain-containing protein [Rothia sp. ZJ932]QRZ61668.1 multicopper oxidase domain-containing protein [Rothia sp. ZJ932]
MITYDLVSRRVFISSVGAFATAATLSACGGSGSSSAQPSQGSATISATASANRRPLPVPPILEPTLEGTTKVFALDARTGESEMKPGVQTPTWGYNGALLGPTLRMANGDNVRIDVKNSLPETTTVHWHGMHVPGIADGGPHQPIEPGTSWSASWQVRQNASTLWYHPHPHGETSRHAYRGLAGLFIIDDESTGTLGLPEEYGVDDIPLVIQDRRFNDDGTLDETDLPDLGLLGDTTMLNGITNPHFEATTSRVRFRVLNGSVMRLYNLAFSDDREFSLIGSDGGLLHTAKTVKNLYISPGERAEILVEFAPGDEITLKAVPFTDRLGLSEGSQPEFGIFDSFELLTLSGPASASDAGQVASTLNQKVATLPETSEHTTERSFSLTGFQINGELMDAERIDFTAHPNEWEIWTITNNDSWIHNFHIHNTQFRVLSYEDTFYRDYNQDALLTDGWKDTVLLPPGVEVKLAVRFTDYTSTAWPYMYHCHLLFHEDQGMMGQFMVVEPGQEPDAVIGNGVTHEASHSH